MNRDYHLEFYMYYDITIIIYHITGFSSIESQPNKVVVVVVVVGLVFLGVVVVAAIVGHRNLTLKVVKNSDQ